MEPGHEDREYVAAGLGIGYGLMPQWSPVMKTGNTMAASMILFYFAVPQWSPVMKTGNTWTTSRACSRTTRLNGARS